MIHSQKNFKSTQSFSSSSTSREKTTKNPTTLICYFVQRKTQQLSLKCKHKISWVCGLIWTVSYSSPGKTHSQLLYETTNTSKQKSRAQFVILQVFLQAVLTSSPILSFLPEQVKFRKTRWHLRFAWNCCSVCHHQHGNGIELDDLPPTPPLFTSASIGITSGSLHFHLKKPELSPRQARWNKLLPSRIHPSQASLSMLFALNNVISWKNKASINSCGHFVAIKSFFPLKLCKPTQSNTQHLIYFLCILYFTK